MTPEKDQEYREEAERLALLSKEEQKAILALHRGVADNPKAPKTDRKAAKERADALERHLQKLNRKKKSGR